MSESPTETDSTGHPNATVIPPNLEADTEGDSDQDDQTESLDEKVSDYVHEYGRTYHRYKQGSYPYPNDSRELERWDMQHDIFKWLFRNELHFAPITDPENILDLGAGTGKWAIEMGEKYPSATVTGTDLAPTQPKDVPPNVWFDIEDCTEDEWARDEESFDLIHTQIMIGSQESFRKTIRTAYQYLKPKDGWLECVEPDIAVQCDDDSLASDSPLREWMELLAEAAADRYSPPRPLRYASRIAAWMRSAGYVDVKEQVYKLPVNSWPSDPAFKELGRRWQINLLEAMPAVTYKLFGPDGLGWSRHEIEVYLINVRKCLKDRNIHAYQTVHVVWGRRPTKEEEAKIRKQAELRRKERERQRREEGAKKGGQDGASSSNTGPPSRQAG